MFKDEGKSLKCKLAAIHIFTALVIFILAVIQSEASRPQIREGGRDKMGARRLLKVMSVVVGLMLFVYYFIYFTAIFINCKLICQKDKLTKIIFGVNQVVHIMFISAMWAGVY